MKLETNKSVWGGAAGDLGDPVCDGVWDRGRLFVPVRPHAVFQRRRQPPGGGDGLLPGRGLDQRRPGRVHTDHGPVPRERGATPWRSPALCRMAARRSSAMNNLHWPPLAGCSAAAHCADWASSCRCSSCRSFCSGRKRTHRYQISQPLDSHLRCRSILYPRAERPFAVALNH